MTDTLAKIAELQKQIDELKAKAEVEKEWPQKGDTVYSLHSDGYINVIVCGYDVKVLVERTERGEIFLTLDEAKKHDRWKILDKKLRDLGASEENYFPVLRQIIEAYPATPTGHEKEGE